MTAEAFRAHWRERHAPLIARLPGIRGYVQNTPLGHDSAYDAVAESSFDDTQAMKALARSAEYAAVLEDEPRFIDRASMGSVIAEEHVLKDGPRSAIKTIALLKRASGTPVDDFFPALLDEGRVAAAAPGVVRYAQCHARRAIYDSGREPAYDAVATTWLTRAADARVDRSTWRVMERVVV